MECAKTLLDREADRSIKGPAAACTGFSRVGKAKNECCAPPAEKDNFPSLTKLTTGGWGAIFHLGQNSRPGGGRPWTHDQILDKHS